MFPVALEPLGLLATAVATLIVKVLATILLLVPPSLAVTVIVAVPMALVNGMKVNVPVAFGLVYLTVGLGIRDGLLETAETMSVCFSLGAPEVIPLKATVWLAAFSLTKIPDHSDWLYGRGVAKLRKGDTTGGNADIVRAKTIKADIAEEYVTFGIK